MKRKIILPLMVVLTLTGCTAKTTANKTESTTTTSQTQSASYPLSLEIHDSEGKAYTQTFTQAPTRVITNNQSSLELLLQLGLQDSIIGTVSLDDELPENLKDAFKNIPVITESKTEPAKEVIAGMNPDLVIGRMATFTDDKYGSISSLNGMNTNVYTQIASDMRTEQSLDNIFTDIQNVGKIFNVEDKANTLVENLKTSLNTVEEKVASVANSEKSLNVMVMTAYNDGTYSVFGSNATLQNEILNVLGGVNINEKGGPQALENLLDLNPDAILYVYNNKNAETDKTAVEALKNNDLLKSVTAIKNNKVFEVSYTEFMGYGTRVIDCIEDLSTKLYPELSK